MTASPPATDAVAFPAANPYVGPRTFTYAERKFFFGREREARDLGARVVSERLLLFYAQSGAGKSSLLNTRVIPQLREEEGFAVLPVGRVSGDLPEGVTAVDNIYLFNLMASIDQGDPARLAQVPLATFLGQLVSDDGETWQFDATADAEGAATGHRYILIIDQFEEIVTAHPERWSERSEFFCQLNQVLRKNLDLWVLLTLREDYIANLDPYAKLVDGKLQARFYMERMGLNGARAAVQEPAQLAGRPYAPGVAEQLVDDLRRIRAGAPGPTGATPLTALGDYVEPVQLQIVCFGLWNRLPPGDRPIQMEDYRAFGNVDQALTNFYEDALVKVSQSDGVSERQLRAWFDTQLITPAGTRGLVYRDTETTAGLPNGAVDQLANIYLIRAEVRGGNRYYELAHDRLLEPVLAANRRWLEHYDNPFVTPTRNWLAAGRDPARLLDGLQLEQARAYATANAKELLSEEQEFLAESEREEAEQRAAAAARVRMRRILTATGLVIGFILLALTLWAITSAEEARRERDRAVTAEANTLRNESRRLANLALQQIAVDPVAALNLSLYALPDFRQPVSQRRPAVPEAEAALWQALHSSAERKYVPAAIYFPDQVDIDARGILVAEAEDETQSQVRYYDLDLNALITVPVTATANALSGVRWADDGRMLTYDAENVVVFQGEQQIAARQLMTATGDYPALSCAEWRPWHNQLVACTDRGIVLWSPAGSEAERALVPADLLAGGSGLPTNASWSPSGDWLAAWGERAVLVNLRTEQPLQIPTDSEIAGLQFITTTASTRPATEQLLVSTSDGRTQLWSTEGELLRSFDEQCAGDCAVNGALLSPDGRQLLTYLDTGDASLWDFASGEQMAWLEGHTASILSADWRDQYVATASVDGTAIVWDANTGEALVTLRGQRADERMLGIHWLDDGRLFTYSQGNRTDRAPGSLRLWQIFDEDDQLLCRETDNPRCHFMGQALLDQGPTDTYSALRWLDNTTVVAARLDGSATRWDVENGESATLPGDMALPSTVVWSPTGDRLLRYTPEGVGEQWRLGPRGWVMHKEMAEPVRVARWLPAGLLVDTGAGVEIYDALGDAPPFRLSNAGLVDALQPTTTTLIVATDDGLLQQWDVEDNSPLLTLALAPDGRVRYLESSGDGKSLLAVTTLAFSDTVTLWDLSNGQPIWSWSLPATTLNAPSASLSPDQRYVAIVQDGLLSIYEPLAAGATEPIWTDNTSNSIGVVWNRDGSKMLTWGNSSARLWRWEPATRRATPLLSVPHYSYATGPVLNADETQLLTENADQTMRIWRVWPDLEGLITTAEGCCITRELSDEQRKEFVID